MNVLKQPKLFHFLNRATRSTVNFRASSRLPILSKIITKIMWARDNQTGCCKNSNI